MATFTVNARQQQKIDTAANWTSKNTVLLLGEIGVENDTGKIKVGNGVLGWNSLSYIGITTEYLQANYLSKTNPVVSGAMALTDSNSKIQKTNTSPAGNALGVTGVMITHFNSDEGGLLINEDGAYLWNSTDSGSLLKGLDEDLWTSNTGSKKDCTFDNGLMFNFDSAGNLKLKGTLYVNKGATAVATGTNAQTITNQRSGTLKTWSGTTAQYNALTSKDSTTLYFLT